MKLRRNIPEDLIWVFDISKSAPEATPSDKSDCNFSNTILYHRKQYIRTNHELIVI